MRHLELNMKVNEMKGKNKPISLIFISLLLISMLLIIAYTPNSFAFPTVQHTATVSPVTTTLPRQKYVFNITNLSNATEKITEVKITFPSGFTSVSVEAPTDWIYSGWPIITFSNNTAASAINPNDWKLFNITVDWPAVPPTTYVVKVNCTSFETPSINNPVSLTITFNPQFTATITPTLPVKGGTSYNFNVTVKNLASSVGLGTINITYPNGWSFNVIVNYGGSRPWSIIHDEFARTFKLWGPNLLIGEAVWMVVNMTTQSSTADPVYWNATAWDISRVLLGTHNLPVTVDGKAPTVIIDQPPSGIYYTVGAGKKIWINGTVSDDLNITKYGLTLTINDTARFERVVYAKVNDYNYTFAFANKTAIPDGKLAIKITAIDASGRTNSTERTATIDNTAPEEVYVEVLDQSGNKLPYVSGVYWIGAGTESISVKASFSNLATPITGWVYFNTTGYEVTNGSLIETPKFDVKGSDYVLLKITLVDNAKPIANNFTRIWEIKRDKVKPSAPTFTVQPICGGAIIRALNATDNIEVLEYKVYIGNEIPVPVSLSSLRNSTLTPVKDIHRAFAGILVLNLTSYAGETVDINITAVDYGGNEGPGRLVTISVPEGTWHPVELYPGWNLVSLPLIPNSTSTADIYSLILKQGVSGVKITYGFDNVEKKWVMNPTTMIDGKGYWIYMKEYDVLIVQGFTTPTPPALPTTYHLTKGWNLVGYTAKIPMNASVYLESLEPGSYFRWLYIWNATSIPQSWSMIDTKPATSGTLRPGQAFWIYLYKDQDLVPPISK
jgi:hypothetical protein